jgi:serine/threonine protein kinase
MAFNYPEGAVSILTEYHEEGSLLDLLKVVLALPESAIRTVFKETCEILK